MQKMRVYYSIRFLLLGLWNLLVVDSVLLVDSVVFPTSLCF